MKIISGIKDLSLNPNSFITIYDGIPLRDTQMLAQFTGLVTQAVIVGYENRELTVIIITGNMGRNDRINLLFEQVSLTFLNHNHNSEIMCYYLWVVGWFLLGMAKGS